MDLAIRRVNTEADVVWAEGHSDYGMAVEAFWDRFGDEVLRSCRMRATAAPTPPAAHYERRGSGTG